MGFLAVGTPLGWEDAKHWADFLNYDTLNVLLKYCTLGEKKYGRIEQLLISVRIWLLAIHKLMPWSTQFQENTTFTSLPAVGLMTGMTGVIALYARAIDTIWPDRR